MLYSELLTLIEHTWGRKPDTPKDFDELQESILSVTHQMVSVSTLKRLWGYVASEHTPREDVLDILAQYCGYTSWKTLALTLGGNPLPPDSNPIVGECLKGEDIKAGKTVTAMWHPKSRCVFESLGNARFLVKESTGSKLSVGATFTCHQFIQGEPLYLTELRMKENSGTTTYVCGRDAGVKILTPLSV